MTGSHKPAPEGRGLVPLRRSKGAGLLRKSTNITLRVDLVEEAKALDSSNAFVEQHGLPLARPSKA